MKTLSYRRILFKCLMGIWLTYQLLIPLTLQASILSVNLIYVALSSQKMPGFNDLLDEFAPPHLNGGYVAFFSSGQEFKGIFTNYYGFLRSIASNQSFIPFTQQTFNNFSNLGDFVNAPADYNLSILGGTIAFIGADRNWNTGVYANSNQQTQLVANDVTPIPGIPAGNFNAFAYPIALPNGGIAFWGAGQNNQEGLYSADNKGLLTKLIDNHTLMPNTKQTFKHFLYPSFSRVSQNSTDFVFVGKGNGKATGLYFMHQQKLITIATNNSQMPSPDIGYFIGFRDASYDATSGKIAFIGEGILGQTDIFIYDGHTITAVVSPRNLVPSTIGHFSHFSSPILIGNNLIFEATGSEKSQGIYLYSLNGNFFKVVSTLDTINKKSISKIDISPEGFSGNQVAVLINFTDGSSGIYLATMQGLPY